MAKAAAAPPADDLVPVQLALHGTRQGAVQEWVLWPCAASKAEIRDFADTLVGDLGLQPQLKQPVTQAIVSQVNDWCSSVPPPARGPAPRRELIRLDLVLDGSLRLRDQFWWDLHSDALTPEDFAAELCADAGVEPRHGAAVAAAIRIELAKLRQAPPTNLPLPTPRIGEGQLPANGQQAQLQSVYASGCMRGPEQWQDWGPSLHHLTLEEAQALQQQQAAVQAQHQAAAQQAAVQAQQAAAQEQQQAAAQVQQAAHAQRLQLQQRAAELERLRAAAVQSQAGQPVEQQAPAVEQQAPAEPQLPQLVPQQAVGGMPPQGHTTVVVPSLPHNPLAGQGPRQQQLGMPQLVGVQQPPQQAVQAHALQAMQQQAAVQAAAQQEPEQQQQQQQQQQQPAGKQQGKKRGRGEAGGAAAPGQRQLRPRRASRLAQILREEEESGSGSDDGGHSRDASRRESGPAAAGGRGHQAAHSTGSGDYQPDEDALAAAAEEAEFAARDRKAPKSKAQHKAPRRASGGTAAAAAAAAAAAPAAATAPGTSPSSVAVRRQPVGPGPGLSTFQHHPPVPQPALLPVAAQQPALLPQMAGGSSMPPPMPSLGVMASTSGPGMGGGIVPTTIMLPGQASLGRGPVPMPLPPNPMGPRLESSASAGVAQQLQLVAAAIVHYARELGIGEPKIQSFLACPPDEQLKLYRTLHQLVIQARARQQQQLQAAVMAQQQQAQQQQQQQQMAPLPGLGLGPGPMGGVPPPPMGPPLPLPPMPAPLPPMPLEAVPQSAGPAGAGQYANLFSEMFD